VSDRWIGQKYSAAIIDSITLSTIVLVLTGHLAVFAQRTLNFGLYFERWLPGRSSMGRLSSSSTPSRLESALPASSQTKVPSGDRDAS
jgi:hypothetical protein